MAGAKDVLYMTAKAYSTPTKDYDGDSKKRTLWYPRQRRAHVFSICDACFSFSFHGRAGVKDDDHWTNPLEFPVHLTNIVYPTPSSSATFLYNYISSLRRRISSDKFTFSCFPFGEF